MQTPSSDSHTPRSDETLDIVLLNRTARRLSAKTPLHEVLDEIVRFVTDVVESDSCMIYVLEEDELVLRSSKNPHPEAVDRTTMSLGQGITGWVAEHMEPVALRERAYTDPRFKLFNELPEDRFEAFLSVPVVSGGRLVGVINLQNRATHLYSEREIRLVATIGFLIGAEVERARLESENSLLLDRLETRESIDRAKGMLQRNLEINEDDAYRMMRRESQDKRKPMKEIAQAILRGYQPARRSR
jgi:uroporphyrinogen-III synthase